MKDKKKEKNATFTTFLQKKNPKQQVVTGHYIWQKNNSSKGSNQNQ